MNKGLMVYDIKLATECRKPVDFYGRTGGIVPEPAEILGELETLAGKGKD